MTSSITRVENVIEGLEYNMRENGIDALAYKQSQKCNKASGV
jgi:hypothetical protein